MPVSPPHFPAKLPQNSCGSLFFPTFPFNLDCESKLGVVPSINLKWKTSESFDLDPFHPQNLSKLRRDNTELIPKLQTNNYYKQDEIKGENKYRRF